MKFQTFSYHTLDEIRQAANGLSLTLPLSEVLRVLRQPVSAGPLRLANRIAIQPMEGCDGTPDGRPDTLTQRRYRRFARGGAGLIWFEATAIVQEGRANPRQLYLNKKTLDSFRTQIEEIKEEGMRQNGFAPVVICQLTHSGRYAKPEGVPAPLIAYNNPLFEKEQPIDKSRIVSDDKLKRLEEAFGATALLAQEAGFDGADIKCCHRYLLSEMLSAFTRPGDYGGAFENRTRLLRNAIFAAKGATSGEFLITSRVNLYDGFAYPYGFGVSPTGGLMPDLTEPKALVTLLHEELRLPMLDFTIGNPYVNPHVNRPYDGGPYVPDEHPLEGVARMLGCIGQLKKAFPSLCVIGSGFSYLRQFSPYLAAGAVEQSVCDLAGFGRMAFAYPDFPRDTLYGEGFNARKTCIACGKCSALMRAGTVAGCVVRDGETYLPFYQAHCCV